MENSKFSHTKEDGRVNMVDVGDKVSSERVARAKGHIRLGKETIDLIRKNNLKKGSVLSCAQVAGIMAAKKCPELIPLCHTLLITKIDVELSLDKDGVYAESMVRCTGKTGVEMEALTAVSVALLTVYDMCKAVDKYMVIDNTELIGKSKKPCKTI
ncbi:MAG: cyclic pyranopterin monophosphate synthase MoaC [Bacteroidales bacterium]